MFKDEIYVAGGYNSGNLKTVEIYNPVTKFWRSGPSLVKVRDYPTMEVVNNDLYLFGGYNQQTMEKLVGDKWVEDNLQFMHSAQASVTVICPKN